MAICGFTQPEVEEIWSGGAVQAVSPKGSLADIMLDTPVCCAHTAMASPELFTAICGSKESPTAATESVSGVVQLVAPKGSRADLITLTPASTCTQIAIALPLSSMAICGNEEFVPDRFRGGVDQVAANGFWANKKHKARSILEIICPDR